MPRGVLRAAAHTHTHVHALVRERVRERVRNAVALNIENVVEVDSITIP